MCKGVFYELEEFAVCPDYIAEKAIHPIRGQTCSVMTSPIGVAKKLILQFYLLIHFLKN